jgi:hypothetical protein
MFIFLKKKFTTISWAVQMNIWHKFMSFHLSDHPLSTGLASKIRDLASEWKALQVSLDKDTFLSFVPQASVTPNSALCLDFEQRLELEVQQDHQNKAPGFDEMIHLLEICRQQEELSNGKSRLAVASLQQQPSIVMEASPTATSDLLPFDQQAFLTGVPENEWGKALEFYVVTANRCYACGRDNHYMRDCPTRARGIPLNCCQRVPRNFSFRPIPQNFQQSTLAPFYPIFGAMYPPPGLNFPQHQFLNQSVPQFPSPPNPYYCQPQQPQTWFPGSRVPPKPTTNLTRRQRLSQLHQPPIQISSFDQ